MDSLTLKGLRFNALHGYYEEEREQGNDFEVDLEFGLNLRPAGETDDLSKTIDYQKAEMLVRKVMEGPSIKLIETLALRIGDSVFEQFAELHKLEVAVRKLSPPIDTQSKYSEVTMSWQRPQ
jgi:dihydroneopterin aldolase